MTTYPHRSSDRLGVISTKPRELGGASSLGFELTRSADDGTLVARVDDGALVDAGCSNAAPEIDTYHCAEGWQPSAVAHDELARVTAGGASDSQHWSGLEMAASEQPEEWT